MIAPVDQLARELRFFRPLELAEAAIERGVVIVTNAALGRSNPNVLTRRLDRATILVHLVTNRIFELNETGTRVWELLGEGLDTDCIVRRLVDEFGRQGECCGSWRGRGDRRRGSSGAIGHPDKRRSIARNRRAKTDIRLHGP